MKHLAISFLVVLLYVSAYARESVIYAFQGGDDGASPLGGLIADKFGNYFGATEFGGGGPCTYIGYSGCGTIFELSPNGKGGWTETVVYRFKGEADGLFPFAGLIFDAAGNLYGTTAGGGTNANIKCPPSCGSAFELSLGAQGWTLTVLHAFKGGEDGGGLLGGLLADNTGKLYGATYLGGTVNWGTFFQLIPVNGTWKFNKLHNFKNYLSGPDGGQPNGTPLLGADGNLYGTTQHGGIYGGGVIYRFSQNKAGQWKERIVHAYGGSSKDEGADYGDFAQDSNGNLYGTGYRYYAYRMSLRRGEWKRTNIHFFSRSKGDGDIVFDDLMVDATGNVYGTTGAGPGVPYGKVYRLSEQGSKWIETVLYLFQGVPDGDRPAAKLLRDASGNLWGTTIYGGTNTNCSGGCGTVYKLTP